MNMLSERSGAYFLESTHTPSLRTDQFSYSVSWSEDDEGFVATVVEFPSLSWIDESRRAAEDGLVNLVTEVLEDIRLSARRDYWRLYKSASESPHIDDEGLYRKARRERGKA